MSSKTNKTKLTPLMAQYNRIKAKYPDALLLFRVGDFYETFGSDAKIAADVLGIVLTKRNNGASGKTELAGFPYHSLDTYLPKLVQAGYRVAICDQLEDASKTKSIVKRGVTEVITPGVATNDKILDHKSNNFLASVIFDKNEVGLSLLDLSTGEFFLAQGEAMYIDKLISSFEPKELLFQQDQKQDVHAYFGTDLYTYSLDDWAFEAPFAEELLQKQFGTSTLKGFGVEGLPLGIRAAGSILHYLQLTEHQKVKHINKLSRIDDNQFVWIDRFTIRNLELIQAQHSSGKSLLDVIDETVTPMGSRMMRRWTVLPLLELPSIQERLDTVESLMNHQEMKDELIYRLKQVGDLERLASKIATQKANPRDVKQLQYSLEQMKPIQGICSDLSAPLAKLLASKIWTGEVVIEQIQNHLQDDLPTSISKGDVIREGVNAQLDQYRDITKHGKHRLAEIQQREQEKTSIHSLKIGFNNVFGYYLEVTNKYKDQVPDSWIRKQTLTNSERYITEELKELEDKILEAQDSYLLLEQEIYDELLSSLAKSIDCIQSNAKLLAEMDCLSSFATTSAAFGYCKPEVNDGYQIKIEDGRHPVIEQQLPLGESYVANSIELDNQEQQIMIITGPNMSGKSAILRQTALICLLAQMGCFVPAKAAQLGIIDKLFTRVGASDNLSVGESTFMVEMLETSSIMNNISDRSLILLDEIGRGTSTYDGISIAWSIAEYLHENPTAHPKTLFATHYHELNDLAEQYPRIKNFHVATKQIGQDIIFLRQLVAGGSAHSFGIHVAQLAGMPKWIVQRAQELLNELEQSQTNRNQAQMNKSKHAKPKNQYQLNIFEANDPIQKEVLEEIGQMDVTTITPVEALLKLNEIKQKLK